MKTKSKEQTLTTELRDTLKTIMQNEIEKLPITLEQIEPKERVNIICKLMPFVFPKLNTISATEGEPLQW
jgi:hypothetical protein